MQNNNYLIFRGPNAVRCPSHVNSEMEIVIVKKGTINIRLGNSVINTNANEAVFVLPYEPHAYTPEPESVGFVYMFSFNLVEDFYKKYGGNNLSSAKFPLPLQLLSYLEYANLNIKENNDVIEQNTDELFAKSLLYPLITEFLKSNFSVVAHNNLNTVTVRRIVDYIRENLTEKLTLSSVSTALGINSATLSAILMEYTNIPFTAFVNNLRIEKATRLLHECDVTIAEAAYLSGFGSIRNFNRIFYDTLGLTPTEYKKAKP